MFFFADNPPDLKPALSQLQVKEEICDALPACFSTIEGNASGKLLALHF